MRSVPLSADFVERRDARRRSWIRRDLAEDGDEALWGPLAPLGDAKGRGGIGTLTLGGVDLVVRPYRRGGALGTLLHDRYVRPGRARAELELLAALRRDGVPVVVPVAALARRRGAFWQLRLVTERLAGALPVPAFLATHPELRRFAMAAVGVVVRLAFEAGLRHPDLHLDNVLCVARGDRVRAVLVDLDRARLRKPLDEATRDAMLVRMQRHVARHRGRLAAVPTRSETMRFLRALGWDRQVRHAAWRRLAAAVDRALSRRRWIGRSR